MSERRTALFVATLGIAATYLLMRGHVRGVNAQTGNARPAVKITAPQNNSIHAWNTLVDYSIVVTDEGKSTKYQEIPSKQVVLTTTYVPDISARNADSGAGKNEESAGLEEIAGLDCIGCHQFRAAGMGPSFAAISQRYRSAGSAMDVLAKYIHDGSVGAWGQARMPAHPQLSEQQLQAISNWILKDADVHGVNYYVGTEGTFQMGSPEKPGPNAGLALTASYARAGGAESANQNSRGEDTIVLRGK